MAASSASSHSRRPVMSSSNASIALGRAAYANGQHKIAIENFTLVAHCCPCNRGRHGRRERCKCKDFAKVARDGGDVFHEAMHNCSCNAKKFAKCHEAEHIQALDYRIHVFDKMGRYDKAKKDAEWLLEIAPRALEGYLRLGKSYRLSNEPEVAYAIWTAGIEVGGREGHGGSTKLDVSISLYDHPSMQNTDSDSNSTKLGHHSRSASPGRIPCCSPSNWSIGSFLCSLLKNSRWCFRTHMPLDTN